MLVHGSFADASGFNGVIQRLHARGHPTIAPPNPLRTSPPTPPTSAVSSTSIDGPIVLVGHSYGGIVITGAATGNPDVKALVYINAFAPAAGETASDLAAKFPGSMLTPREPQRQPYPPTDPAASGQEATINADVFREAFTADLERQITAVMAATQRPIDLATCGQPSGPPAWETIPSWFIVGTDDSTIPSELHRFIAARADAVRTVELRRVTRRDDLEGPRARPTHPRSDRPPVMTPETSPIRTTSRRNRP